MTSALLIPQFMVPSCIDMDRSERYFPKKTSV